MEPRATGRRSRLFGEWLTEEFRRAGDGVQMDSC